MKILAWLFSLGLHCGVLFIAVFFAVTEVPSKKLSLPVYDIDLVRLAPQGKPDGGGKKPAQPKPQRVGEKPKAIVRPDPAPKILPKPVAKPKPDIEKKTISSSKPEARPKKEPVKKKPKKKKPKKPAKTKSQIVAEALAEARKKAAIQAKKDEQTRKKALAALRRQIKNSTEEKIKAVGPEEGGEGDSDVQSGLAYIYGAQIKEIIRSNWRYPSIPITGDMVAEVRIEVTANGYIESYTLLKKSGRTDFDDSVLKAIEETRELPPPPGRLRNFNINFNMGDMQ